MNVKELILSDLESAIDKSRIDPVDRWIINDNGKQINVQIEDCTDVITTITHAPVFDKVAPDMTLLYFIEKYCTSLKLESKNRREHSYDPRKRGKVTTNAGGFILNYSLQLGQKACDIFAHFNNGFGYDIDILQCELFYNRDDSVTFYNMDGCSILFGKELLSFTYLFGYFNVNTKQSLYSVYNIENPEYPSLENYGIKYIGDLKKGVSQQMDDVDNLIFDLTLYNEQRNKDFTKGLVALPFMMTSSGILIQSEMFIPMRKTEIKDAQTRVVYNYLYRL